MIEKALFAQLRELFSSGKASVVEVIDGYFASIEKGKILNCYITTLKDKAIKQAKESDKRYREGSNRPLEGLPLGIKDLFCTKGVRTTASSKILDNFVPTYTATVVSRLLESGAIALGKQNSDEFAMGSTNENSAFGPVHNPWKKGYIPGGSSGGSAASVSAGQACTAIGTDTGGSVRQPAAMTGVVGFRPSYGRFSRWGIIPFASSLDQAGILARSVKDVISLYQVMAGYDEKDPTTSSKKVEKVDEGRSFQGTKIGLISEYNDLISNEATIGLHEDITSSLENEWNCKLVDISTPYSGYAHAIYHVLSSAEASSNLAKYDGIRYGKSVDSGNLPQHEEVRSRYFGDEVKRRIMLGSYVLSVGHYSEFYAHAQKIRSLIRQDFEKAFEKVDFIVHPCTPTTAFSFGSQDKMDSYKNDMLTTQSPMAGVPSICIPAGFDQNGLPIGIQITAPRFKEADLLAFTKSLEDKMNIPTFVKDRWWEA